MIKRSDLVKEFLDKYPDLPDKTVADIFYKSYPLLFSNPESARGNIRYYRGHCGEEDRKKTSGRKYVKPLTFNTTPWAFPESYYEVPTKYDWPLQYDNIGLISDVHFPYHDSLALSLALDYLLDQGINALIINGDLLDMYKISRWTNIPTKPSIKEELDMGRDFFFQLRKKFGDQLHVVYGMGNHEQRYEEYLLQKAPELYGDSAYTIHERLNLKDYQIISLPNKYEIDVLGLSILHGDSTAGKFGGGVNPAKYLYDKIGKSGLISHVHRTHEYTKRPINGKIIKTWTTGCLCGLRPHYDAHNSTNNHGFAQIKLIEGQFYNVYNKTIENGKIL